MSLPSPERLFAAVEHTWPPAAWHGPAPWRVPEGRGGGKRVCAARLDSGNTDVPDIAQAEAALARLDQGLVFQVSPNQTVLDAALAERGYTVLDPMVMCVAPIDQLAIAPPPVTTFVMPEPLAIMREIWAAGGIGPARLDVMNRAPGPSAMALGRTADKPAGTAFCALDGDLAMLHAIEVLPAFRRKGTARNLIHALSLWAREQGSRHMGLAVIAANSGARALYRSLGMTEYEGYHYRIAQKDRQT